MHKLLLADDSVTIQRVIELTFSGEDIQVIAVNDGEQAIARILVGKRQLDDALNRHAVVGEEEGVRHLGYIGRTHEGM